MTNGNGEATQRRLDRERDMSLRRALISVVRAIERRWNVATPADFEPEAGAARRLADDADAPAGVDSSEESM